jgi:basic membrane protein A and related proteins
MINRRTIITAVCVPVLVIGERVYSATQGIAIAYALGGKGDQSYNDACAGALPFLRNNFDLHEFSPLTLPDYSRALNILTRPRPSIIFCIGYMYDAFVNKLGPNYPDTLFCIIDGSPPAVPNALSIQFRVGEASTLAGVVAADISKTKTVAFVGGSDIPVIREFLEGYEAGARRLDPGIRILASYIGSGPGAFRNSTAGKDIGLRLIDAGADVLFHAAGASGDGVIAAAQQRSVKAIGVDVDQTHLAPETVVTNVVKRIDNAMLIVAEKLLRKEPLHRGVMRLGLKDNGVEITAPPPLSEGARQAITFFRGEFGQAQ